MIEVSPESLLGGERWQPEEGSTCRGVLRRALPTDEEAREAVLASASSILGQGVPPSGPDASRTGLVVGYVQSGKTLSFTTVIGLARDNGFPLVIVLAGTKNNLLDQSEQRLERDLNATDDREAFSWRILRNPDEDKRSTVERVLANWIDPDEDERPTIIVVVLKHARRIETLTRMLAGLDFGGLAALVIDDEADQASLNTRVRANGESATFAAIKLLRDTLPRHTFLQYTATPQAPLLINILNTLSPDFVHVLEAGSGYVGGKEFFAPGSLHVEDIPPGDVFADDALPDGPPDSLVNAMRLFFVGLAATLIEDQENGRISRRSMLVHPSRARAVHRTLTRWVEQVVATWRAGLGSGEDDPDRVELVADFRAAYEDLKRTAPGLPAFEQVVRQLPRALGKTEVIEFNTNGRPTTPEIQWRDARGWILVGGQAVDRGFTVDSLTVTYMPRGTGMGHADAVQQRARFFGYKRSYLGLCRIFLSADTRRAFTRYVEHEEAMRASLLTASRSGDSLKNWKRRFILDDAMKPCRDSVIALGDEYSRAGRVAWTQQEGAWLTPEVRSQNAATVAALVRDLTFVRDTTFASDLPAQQHEVADAVPLGRVLEFLGDYLFPDPVDTLASVGIMLQIGHVLSRDANATARVLRMRPGFRSTRTVDDDGRMSANFLQGRTGTGRDAYPGDTAFRDANRITVQLHSLDLRWSGHGTARSAPMLAIHVPRSLVSDWLVQDQGDA